MNSGKILGAAGALALVASGAIVLSRKPMATIAAATPAATPHAATKTATTVASNPEEPETPMDNSTTSELSAQTTTPPRNHATEQELAAGLPGKTKTEIIAMLGIPDNTGMSDGRVAFYYWMDETHPHSWSVDDESASGFHGSMAVWFNYDGTVEHVSF